MSLNPPQSGVFVANQSVIDGAPLAYVGGYAIPFRGHAPALSTEEFYQRTVTVGRARTYTLDLYDVRDSRVYDDLATRLSNGQIAFLRHDERFIPPGPGGYDRNGVPQSASPARLLVSVTVVERTQEVV